MKELAENAAVLVLPSYLTNTKVLTLVRGFTVSEKDVQVNLDFMKEYASSKNSQKEATNRVVAPMAKQQEYPGTWISSRVWYDRESRMIMQELQKLQAVNSADDLSALTPVKEYIDSKLNVFDWKTGDAWAERYTYRNIDPDSRDKLMEGLTTSQVALAIPVWQAGLGFLKRKFTESDNGTATFVFWAAKHDWIGLWSERVQIGQTNDDGYRKTQTHEADGVSNADRDAEFSAAAVQTAGDANYVIHSRSVRKGGQGDNIITRVQAAQFSGTAAADVVRQIREAIDGKDGVCVRIWHRRTAAALATLTTKPTGAAVSDFTIQSVTYTHLDFSVNDNGDNTFTVIQTGLEFFYGSSGVWPPSPATYGPVTLVYPRYRKHKGVWYKRDEPVTVECKYTVLETTAWEFVTPGTATGPVAGSRMHENTRVKKLGPRKYVGFRYIYQTLASWERDDNSYP
jgi:hypothetical protein